jgi:hypothetical protein
MGFISWMLYLLLRSLIAWILVLLLRSTPKLELIFFLKLKLFQFAKDYFSAIFPNSGQIYNYHAKPFSNPTYI